MSRRRQDEMNFGSDSFLDIIANIVGILIILIVIAGVRVSQQAAHVEEPETLVESPAPLPKESQPIAMAYVPPAPLPPMLPIPEIKPKPEPVLTAALPWDPALTRALIAASEPKEVLPPPSPKPKPRPVMQPSLPPVLKAVPPSPELLNSIAKLQSEIQNFNQQSQQADENQKQLAKWDADLTQQIEAVTKTLQSEWENSRLQKKQLLELKRSLEQTKLVFIGQERELTEAEKQKAPAETLRHKLTPVSKTVDGNEVHFHVKNNKVAFVPLMELVERMKPQIQRQREWLIKYREHRGRVGPYRGFQLDYVVVRQRLSALEEARNGGVARIMPILLRFEPQEELTEEALDQALRPGSVFIRELQMADINTTLTFWVYPDSYGMYRQLKEFAHAEGFTVAARPLEKGDVITASPWGSKSAGQ